MSTESALPESFRMTAAERRASVALAGLFATRMLGLFLLMPVFAVAAQSLVGGTDPARVGLALGMYGLTQAIMQIPFGLASDRLGRKPVVLAGLALFVLGSVVCAITDDIFWVTIGRAIQGSGAISAAVTAWLADLTRDEVRTKAMAIVGSSIGLAFAVSLVAAPVVVGWGGLSGLFWTITLLGVLAFLVALILVPVPSQSQAAAPAKVPVRAVAQQPDLMRFNFGVFVLHLIQVALFVVVPTLLAQTGDLKAGQLWKVYLPVIVVSFAFMIPIVFAAEKRAAHRNALRGGVAGLALVCACLPFASTQFTALVVALTAFFVAFNVLEALQPSMVSRIAPVEFKGLALGFYNTSQAAGLFTGGALGGWLAAQGGSNAVFIAAAGLALIWLVAAWRMRPLPPPNRAAQLREQLHDVV